MTATHSATETPLDETELTLLIDYHDDQDSAAEAADCPEASLYHAKRSKHFGDLREEIRSRDAAALKKIVSTDRSVK